MILPAIVCKRRFERVSFQMSELSEISRHSARAGFRQRASAELFVGRHFGLPGLIGVMTKSWPNKSLEPTGVGAGSYSLRLSGTRESQVAGGSVLGR